MSITKTGRDILTGLFAGLAVLTLATVALPHAALAADAELAGAGLSAQAADAQAMYRLYNPWSGEHFYTADASERNGLIQVGWTYEGVGWMAPQQGDPVYRLYNPNGGGHHYTKSAGERDLLVSRHGWTSEGVAFYSAAKGSARVVTVNRVYNGGLMRGQHHYTTSTAERDNLVRYHGWANEGVGFYGLK